MIERHHNASNGILSPTSQFIQAYKQKPGWFLDLMEATDAEKLKRSLVLGFSMVISAVLTFKLKFNTNQFN